MVGCISDLKVKNKELKSDEQTVGVVGCLPEYSAPGLFFGSGGGYGALSMYTFLHMYVKACSMYTYYNTHKIHVFL